MRLLQLLEDVVSLAILCSAKLSYSGFEGRVDRRLTFLGRDRRAVPTPICRCATVSGRHLLAELIQLGVEFRDLLLGLHELSGKGVELLADRLDLLRELADLRDLLLDRRQVGSGCRFW